MIAKGFQINLEPEDGEKVIPKTGLAGNVGSYGESVIRFVKREVSIYDDDDEEEDE